ncbi:UMP kinase [Candidatus Xianfuyuplasma coldseepsis]|uniref:Uridylate kinase n=1 Tax=Candidatus Xianfuyuplasma coldseepsis TaxID=2782163 RepID=A0A7L7KUK0_9MOLU|nr:UMP kinase [Xianfuyuplasma coldseepsis]QMS85448.1 UMP kinase [Xianfuyuplasma coldseepsis]
MSEKTRVILKLSGEALSNGDSQAIDPEKVRAIAKEVKMAYDLDKFEIGIIVGGGNIWRGKTASEMGMERSSADYMGMIATILNALALQNAIEELGIETRTMTSLNIPQVAEPYIRRKAISNFEKNRIVIFGGGTGNPYFSTDTTSALRAAELGAKRILMAKNGTDGVYDKDPRKYKDATKYTQLTHQEVLELGLGVMDSTASALCKDNDIEIVVFDMNQPGNIKRAAAGDAVGTRIY